MLTIHKASAGSGKTYNLALEYIKLLLGRKKEDGSGYALKKDFSGRPHSSILAITFTNKATAEMKTRILKELHGLATPPVPGRKDAAFAKELQKEFGCSREDLRQAAHMALRRLLNDYGAFNVSTIDSFFQTVLRSFARELERQGDYRLELDGHTALSQSMTMLLEELDREPDSKSSRAIFGWLADQAAQRLKNGNDSNPFDRKSAMYRDIVDSLEGIFNETFAASEQQMDRYLQNPARLEAFARWLADEIERMKKEVHDACDDMLPLAAVLKGAIPARIEKVAAWHGPSFTKAAGSQERIFDIWLSDSTPGYLQDMRDGNIKGCFTAATLKKFTPTSENLAAMNRWVTTIDRCLPTAMAYEEMLARTNTLRAIFHIKKYIERYRQDNNLILISDSNSLLKAIIDGSDTPFIYERIGMKLENYLIDEFQDTSRMQWDNLRPLIDNKIDTADSLIIGDVKQAIYQFRGGDPSLLDSDVKNYYENAPTNPRIDVRGEGAGENRNFRSAHPIVRFNNTLFRLLADEGGTTTKGYGGVEQTPDSRTAGMKAHIRINNLLEDKLELTAPELLSAEAIEELRLANTFTPRDVAMRSVAQAVVEQLKRGYRQSDIAILCRWNRNAADMAEYITRNYGKATADHPAIRVVSEDSLLLKNSGAVKLILGLLEIIDRSLETADRSEQTIAEAIGQSALFRDDKEREKTLKNFTKRRRRAAVADNFEYYYSQGKDIEAAITQAIEDSEKIGSESSAGSDIARDLDDIRRNAPANLPALVQAIIMRKIPAPQRAEELPYIAAFVDLVEDFSKSYTPSVHSFLAYWNEQKDRAAIAPGERDEAVTITTIHKAKGLEWPCVHIPLLNWPLEESPDEEWFATDTLNCPEGVEAPPIMRLFVNRSFSMPSSPFYRHYNELRSANRIDNLNVAYVAFTRAVNELNVNVLPSKESSNTGIKILDLLAAAPNLETQSDELYLNFAPWMSDTSFRFGDPTFPEEKDDDEGLPVEEAPQFTVTFDSLGSRIGEISRFISQPTGAEGDMLSEEEQKKETDITEDHSSPNTRTGTILHSILAKTFTLDELDTAVASHSRIAPADELRKYSALLHRSFASASAQVLSWFSPDNPRVLTEQSIYNSVTDEVKRADRIVWHPDGTVEVIDYKFTNKYDDDHKTQVARYGNALKAMGYENVKATLWYPLTGRVTSVSLE